MQKEAPAESERQYNQQLHSPRLILTYHEGCSALVLVPLNVLSLNRQNMLVTKIEECRSWEEVKHKDHCGFLERATRSGALGFKRERSKELGSRRTILKAEIIR